MIYEINNNECRFIRKGRASKTNGPSLFGCCCFSTLRCNLFIFVFIVVVFFRIVQIETETRAISQMVHYESVLESNVECMRKELVNQCS